MAVPPPLLAPLRFGIFELDPERWELRRRGVLLSLQAQPCRLLHLLASQPGRVVSRDEIRQHLWPGELAGDFDSRINFCLAQIRNALGDDAANPRFVETVRGCGYSFMAPVREAAEEAAVITAPPVPALPRMARHGPLTVAAGLVLAAGLCWGLLAHRRSVPFLSPEVVQSTVLVASPDPLNGDIYVGGGEIFYTAATPSGQAIFRVAEAGGARVPIATGMALPEVIAASPDGSQLAVREDGLDRGDSPAWIVPAAGGVARRFGHVRAPFVAWRPDGGAVAFSAQHAVWLADAAGEHVRQLATLPGLAGALAWSADGRRLAVASSALTIGSSAFWEVDAVRGTVRTLRHLPGLDSIRELAWTADQRFLVFVTIRSADGINELAVLSLPQGRSPGGFSVLRTGANGIGLAGAALDAGGRILAGGPARWDEVLRYDRARTSWTPFLNDARDVNFRLDGARLAYVRVSDLSLWVADASGAHARELVGPPMQAMLPRWSPDGSQLAFDARTPTTSWRLYRIGGDGHGLQPLSDPDPANSQGAPTWSPDGRTLLYANALCGSAADCGIHRLDLGGQAVRLLRGSLGLRTARWSPDGRWVAALEARSNNVMLLDLAAPDTRQQWRRLWPHSVDDFLAWSADSRNLYFVPRDEANATIERLTLAPGAVPVEVASYRDPTPSTANPYDWFDLGPGDTPMLAHIGSGSAILALTVARH